ncbi:MAG: Smr/MutS family protein [Pseudomonadota bacterium]
MTRRRLSSEDREVWARYSRTTEPLDHRPRAPDPHQPVDDSFPTRPIAPIRPFSLGDKAKPHGLSHSLAPSIREEVAGHPLRMDAKAHKRMRSGKLRPEGKLDLHGMTLDRAHPALIRFVLDGHAQGKRLLLIVTGKGKSKPSVGPMPNRLGVLKHQVPQWLRMPPLSNVVLQIDEAHRSHGGSGAYYVYLRRTR